jgi:hypothetical protein
LVSSVVSSVLASGRGVAVGCASGADALALSAALSAGASPVVFAVGGPSGAGFWRGSALALVRRAAAAGCSVRWWAGGPASVPLRRRLRSRSVAFVSAVAASGPGAGLVGFVAGGWSVSPGSWGSVASALAAGLPVVVFPVPGPRSAAEGGGCAASAFPRSFRGVGRVRWVRAGSGVWSAGFLAVSNAERRAVVVASDDEACQSSLSDDDVAGAIAPESRLSAQTHSRFTFHESRRRCQMLNLPKLDLASRQWLDLTVPLRNTLLEALFPGVRFAIVHADPGQYDQMVAALSQPIEGLRLDFASGGRKHGDFFLSDADPLVASHFWDTAEKAIAYGGTLVTDCLSVHVVPDLKVLVVEDGDHATGDCHAKAGPQLWALLDGDEQRALQFRLAVLNDDGKGYLAKGTAVVQKPGGPDLPYDLIIPFSAFKSFQPAPGAHEWHAVVGVVGWSAYRPTRVSYTILQWFSKEALDADVWPHAEKKLERLIAAGESTQAAADYFRVGGEDADYDPEEPLLLNVLCADVHSRLTHHPYVVDRLARLLRRRWLHLALGGGLRWAGLQGLPCDDLTCPGGQCQGVDSKVCAPQLPEGLVIGTRYPVRSWADLRLWLNVHEPGLTHHQGVVWMSHGTALQVGGDFDGDYFLLAPAADFPRLADEINAWRIHPKPEVVKVKERLTSPLDGEHLARVAMDNTDNMVGLITYFIAQANAMGRLDLVNALAPELQIAVDKFKYNLSHDLEKIEAIAEQLDRLAWLADQKDPHAFLRRPLRVANAAKADDSISHLARRVIQHWQPPKLAKRPLVEFAPLFSEPTIHRDAALKLSVRYAKLIGEALRQGGKDAFKPIFRALGDWAETRPDPDAWAAAVWHAVHRKGKRGSGSLAFNAFPGQVMERLAQQPKLPERVAIVGLRHNDYAISLDLFFDGTPFEVAFRAELFNDELRTAAYVEGKRLGYVSKETPVPLGVYTLSLLRRGSVVYATCSPTNNDKGAS